MVVTKYSATVQYVDGELLSQRVRRVAHQHANAEVPHLGILGDGAGTRKRLRQTTGNQADRVAGEGHILRRDGRHSSLRNKLRTEDEEVFDLTDIAVDQGAQPRFSRAVELTEARNLTKLRVCVTVDNQVFRLASRDLCVEQSGFRSIDR